MTERGVLEHDKGHKVSGRAIVDDVVNFIPGVGFVEGVVDATQGLWAGINGDNDAAAKHMYDAAMDVGSSALGPISPLASAVKLGYDVVADGERKEGAMPAQAPTASEAIWDWIID